MRQSFRKDAVCLAFLTVFCAVLYGWKLGSFGLLDPDEPFYSLTAKEMLEAGEFFTPTMFGEPQFEKPILFYWVEVLNFKLFGVNEFAARLGPCLVGIFTVIVTFLWGRTIFRRREPAFLAAAMLAGAAEFVVVSRIVLTDIFLCFFVTAALACFSLGYENSKARGWAWNLMFFFCGLGFLTKGPLGILLPFFGIVPFLILSGEKALLKKIPWRWGLLLFSLVAFPWYWAMAARHGAGFLEHFFVHENIRRFFYAEHRNWDNILVYAAALIVGFFPWSAMVLPAFFHSIREAIKNRSRSQKMFLFLSCALFIPFCFFTIAKSKLLSYILPVFPVLALMAGAWAWRFYRARFLIKKLNRGFLFSCFVFLIIFPPALVLGTGIFAASSKINLFYPLLTLAVSFVPLSWASFICLTKKRWVGTFGLLLAAALFFSGIVFGWILPAADSLFSSRNQVRLFKKHVPEVGNRLLLTGKINVRGISYLTGNLHVGVLTDNPAKTFYTKHPIPLFSTREELLKIPVSEFPVYCFLRPKEFRHLAQIISSPLVTTVLEQNAQGVIARLDRTDRRI